MTATSPCLPITLRDRNGRGLFRWQGWQYRFQRQDKDAGWQQSQVHRRHAQGNVHQIAIPHPAIIPKTKPQAEKMAAELKEKMTATEIESAQNSTAVHTIESVVKEILEQSRLTRASK